ncbi:MAG: DUF4255 domain-containing protein [Rhodovulum sp.]
MIDRALGLVVARLNAHLSARFRVSDDLVTLSPLADAEGKPAAEVRNRLALFLINIAHDATPRRPLAPAGGGVERTHPIHLDIYFMLASGHDPDTYGEGLKLMSAALMFFQANPVMTPQTTPEMPEGLSQLSVEISNLRVEELGQLWGNLGGRYVPSVMFKMRSVMIDSAAVTRIVPLIRKPGADSAPRKEQV